MVNKKKAGGKGGHGKATNDQHQESEQDETEIVDTVSKSKSGIIVTLKIISDIKCSSKIKNPRVKLISEWLDACTLTDVRLIKLSLHFYNLIICVYRQLEKVHYHGNREQLVHRRLKRKLKYNQ
jgi:hypothetical protein